MTTTLITGTNKGLGFETARQLVAAGHTVYLGARDAARGAVAAKSVGAHFIELDVTSDASVAAAAERIQAEAGRLDVLVNNAGISGGFISPENVTAGSLQDVYDVNVFGTVRMIHTFLPLLRASGGAIVNVSSGMGSITITSDPARGESALHSVVYSSSKSASTCSPHSTQRHFPSCASMQWIPATPTPNSTATAAPKQSRRVPRSSSKRPWRELTGPAARIGTAQERFPGSPRSSSRRTMTTPNMMSSPPSS